MTALDFSRRANLVERMDPPDGPVAALEATLRRFELTNRLLTRYRYLLQRYILDDMRRDPLREYRLTDLGAGGGDIARWLIRRRIVILSMRMAVWARNSMTCANVMAPGARRSARWRRKMRAWRKPAPTPIICVMRMMR